MNNYPSGMRECDIPNNNEQYARFESWLDENEDALLEEFLSKNGDIPPVKEWRTNERVRWDLFISDRWEALKGEA